MARRPRSSETTQRRTRKLPASRTQSPECSKASTVFLNVKAQNRKQGAVDLYKLEGFSNTNEIQKSSHEPGGGVSGSLRRLKHRESCQSRARGERHPVTSGGASPAQGAETAQPSAPHPCPPGPRGPDPGPRPGAHVPSLRAGKCDLPSAATQGDRERRPRGGDGPATRAAVGRWPRADPGPLSRAPRSRTGVPGRDSRVHHPLYLNSQRDVCGRAPADEVVQTHPGWTPSHLPKRGRL